MYQGKEKSFLMHVKISELIAYQTQTNKLDASLNNLIHYFYSIYLESIFQLIQIEVEENRVKNHEH